MDVPHFFWHFLRFALLWLSGLGAALAGTRDPHTPDDKYVEFGRKFPFVVNLHANDREQPRVLYAGAAVIIREHWVLTAAHVVKKKATNPRVIADDGTVFPLADFIPHPEYVETTGGYFDIALGYSPAPMNLEFYCPLYTAEDEVGRAATIAGYGFHGTFHTGATLFDGQKRAGHNKILRAEKGVLICKPRISGKFPLEFLIAVGDSGGGLFIGNKLAGINSFIIASDGNPDSTYTDESAHTRVSHHVDWIETTIANYAGAGQQPVPPANH
jgi:hypothetical protein